jgi:hypothetical protein
METGEGVCFGDWRRRDWFARGHACFQG